MMPTDIYMKKFYLPVFRFKNIIIIVFLLLILPTSLILAGTGFEKGSWGFFLSYPGAGFKYFSSPQYAIAPRVLFLEGISAGGVRGYRYFNFSPETIKALSGWEFLYFSFEGDESRGSGLLGGFFVGGEYSINQNLYFQMDFGPQYIYLKDSATEISLGDFAFAVNIGINYYFIKQ